MTNYDIPQPGLSQKDIPEPPRYELDPRLRIYGEHATKINEAANRLLDLRATAAIFGPGASIDYSDLKFAKQIRQKAAMVLAKALSDAGATIEEAKEIFTEIDPNVDFETLHTAWTERTGPPAYRLRFPQRKWQLDIPTPGSSPSLIAAAVKFELSEDLKDRLSDKQAELITNSVNNLILLHASAAAMRTTGVRSGRELVRAQELIDSAVHSLENTFNEAGIPEDEANRIISTTNLRIFEKATKTAHAADKKYPPEPPQQRPNEPPRQPPRGR